MANYDELVARAKAGYPESWVPEKKDEVLTGKFVRVEMGSSAFGPAPIVVLEDENGKEWSIWCFHEALLSQFVSASPQSGDAIAVLYLGKVKAKNPTPGRSDTYHNYRVVKDGETAKAIDWQTLGGKAPAKPEEEPSTDDIPF